MGNRLGSPMHDAIKEGNMKKVRKLVERRAQVNAQDCSGWYPLHRAVEKRRRDLVAVLLTHPDIRVDSRDADGNTSLLYACEIRYSDLNTARLILDHGADPNLQNYKRMGPLHVACRYRDLDLVTLLVQHRADVNLRDDYGHTPLVYAVQWGSPEIVTHLLAHKADANLTSTAGLNVLMYTLRKRYGHVALLLPHTQDVDVVDEDGGTALLYAIRWPHVRGARALLERGAALTTPQCLAALQKAAQRGYYGVVLLLATYCVHLDPEDVGHFEAGFDETFLRRWWALFTPAHRYKAKISGRPLFCHSASARQLLDNVPGVCSLRELSRDAVRLAMRPSCSTAQHFVAGLHTLDAPMDVLDVIRLRVPVNRHLLAAAE